MHTQSSKCSSYIGAKLVTLSATPPTRQTAQMAQGHRGPEPEGTWGRWSGASPDAATPTIGEPGRRPSAKKEWLYARNDGWTNCPQCAKQSNAHDRPSS